MIGVLDVEVQAANPLMPLYPMRAYVNSPSSVRVRNVPKKIGDWNITEVQVVAAYPDNSTKTANCVRVGCVWVGTIAGSTSSGKSENGFTIYANGIDENGNAVTGYVLGKGVVEILEADGTITPGIDTHYLHLYDAQPTTPKEGDVYPTEGGYAIWQDGQANVIVSASTLSTQLATKQDALTSNQMAAINSVVDERTTVITHQDGSVDTLNIVGTITARDIPHFESVTSIKLGNSVTETGRLLLSGASALVSVTFSPSVRTIGYSSFGHCSSLAKVTIPDSVTSIGESAFAGCTGLTSVKLGAGITRIEDTAFQGCINLKNVVFSNHATSIGTLAFSNTAIGEISLPYGLTSIGDQAFRFCNNLTIVKIPRTVTSIGENAFANCSALVNLAFVDNTMSTVENMDYYPWGGTGAVGTWHDASKEWVDSQIGVVLSTSF